MPNRKTITSIIFFFLFITSVDAQPKQGQLAADIALPSVSGDTIKLSSLKGKVVLLDFWASWCLPCRATNRNLVKLYQKYKDKGLEIFGVSVDDEKANWTNAIKKDKISWIQVNDNMGWQSKTLESWEIGAIPTSFLIDKEGKLLAMDLQGKELEKALKYLIDK
jgi:peroxiredoxin